jgi:ATP adenylyltransferase
MIGNSRGPGLAARLDRVIQAALASGALQPIATRTEFLEESGLRLVVRVLERLERKQREQRRPGPRANPFLPHDPALFVTELGPDHICLLNKFNVLDRHLLVVTRAFEAQDSVLTPGDFRALGVCMEQLPGIGFYNSGTAAGASQGHKHLQVVPMPLAPGVERPPLEPWFRAALGETPPGSPRRCPVLPFRHLLCGLRPGWARNGPEGLHENYLALANALGLLQDSMAAQPYNLLVGWDWMLVVPRSQPEWRRIPVNALGYAGALLVRDLAGLASLRAEGALQVLAHTGLPGG